MKKFIVIAALSVTLFVPCMIVSGQGASQAQGVPTSGPAMSDAQVAQMLSEPAVSKEDLASIVKQLDSKEFKERQQGQVRLWSLGHGSLAAVAEAAAAPTASVEVRTRLEAAVRYLKSAGPAPLVIATFNADLIVVGEITSDATPLTLEDVALLGEQKKPKTDMHVFDMKVTQVIRYNSAAQREGWFMPASQPARLEGSTIKIMAQADDARQQVWPWTHPIVLQKGTKLIAALHKVSGREEYYLPRPSDTGLYREGNAAFRAEPTDANIRDFKRAGDVTYWPWGKAVDGLRLALIVSPDYEFSGRPVQHVHGKVGLNVVLNIAAALQNVSGKPLAVNLFDLEKGLSAQGENMDADNHDIRVGQPFAPRPTPFRRGAPVDKSNVSVLQPGQVILIGPYGKTPLGCSLEILLDYGHFQLKGGYEVDSDDKTSDGLPLWKGKLQSSPTDVTITQGPEINGGPH